MHIPRNVDSDLQVMVLRQQIFLCPSISELPEYFYFIMDKVSGYNMVCNGFIHEPIKILFTSHKVQKVGAGHTM
jgi:hypothetical protein